MSKGTTTRSIRVDDELWEDILLLTGARGDTATALAVGRFEQYRSRHKDQLDALKAAR